MTKFFSRYWCWLLALVVLGVLLVTGWLGLLNGKLRQWVAGLGNSPTSSLPLSVVATPSTPPVVVAENSLIGADSVDTLTLVPAAQNV